MDRHPSASSSWMSLEETPRYPRTSRCSCVFFTTTHSIIYKTLLFENRFTPWGGGYGSPSIRYVILDAARGNSKISDNFSLFLFFSQQQALLSIQVSNWEIVSLSEKSQHRFTSWLGGCGPPSLSIVILDNQDLVFVLVFLHNKSLEYLKTIQLENRFTFWKEAASFHTLI